MWSLKDGVSKLISGLRKQEQNFGNTVWLLCDFFIIAYFQRNTAEPTLI